MLDALAGAPPARGPRLVDKPLVLYGAGNLGRLAVDALKVIDVPVWTVIDFASEERVSPELRASALVAVCVATAPYMPIRDELAERGWQDIVPIYDVIEAYRDVYPLSNGWFTGGLSQTDRDAIGSVLDELEDDVSRAHHLQFIAWHHAREEWSFEDAVPEVDSRYFPEELRRVLRTDERFLDVGAHHGEVMLRFVEISGGFDRMWGIEPDPKSWTVAERALDKLDHKKVTLYPVAVGEVRGWRHFAYGLGYVSQFFESGNMTRVFTIDELKLAPTFMKLHLEGWELDALEGARQTIERHRPILACTIYHNRLGMWETPRWLMRLPNYRSLIRQHAYLGTGVVFYAIPMERVHAR